MKQLNSSRLVSRIYKLCICLLLACMFLFPAPALAGAKQGLLLWFNTVLPTLLPFIILSTLIVRLNIAYTLCRFLHPFIGRIFRVSKNACFPIVIGFLSGIPMGAKTSADLIKEKKITVDEGLFLSIMCNNASPMFVLGYIALSELKVPSLKLPIILILYGSSILTALIFRRFYPIFVGKPYSMAIVPERIPHISQKVYAQSTDISIERKSKRFKIDFTIVDTAIMDGFEVITKIGGYIILFSILAQIILSINSLNEYVRILIVGICEITSGINTIASSGLADYTKIVLILTITAFGGLSGAAQTKSVFSDSGLSIKSYIKAKALNAFVTMCLSLLYVKLVL